MAHQKKKILVISTAGGFGHIRAAQAIADFAKEHFPNDDVEHFNVAEFDESFKRYGHDYDVLTRKLPWLWRVTYAYLPPAIGRWVSSLKGLHNKKVEQYILEKKPDAVLFTNFIIVPMFLGFFEKQLPGTPIGVVITDYNIHPYCNFPSVKYYFVPMAEVAGDLEKFGIKKEKIIITGIPVNPRFYRKENIDDLKAKYGVDNGLPTVLVMTSFRMSGEGLVALMRKLVEFEPKMNVIAVTSGNEDFYQTIKTHFDGKIILVKWTDTIDEYMKIADVIISKAGGLTISECLTLRKPLIMINPTPGHEELNVEFMEKNNFGRRAMNVDQIAAVLPDMILFSRKNQLTLVNEEPSAQKILSKFIN
ncbi:hypothetical protein KW786_02955 [Candidatus Parcubacteria bacterium]|nr:hypothetical protein [Candidatus Parcubacteria bacterium]